MTEKEIIEAFANNKNVIIKSEDSLYKASLDEIKDRGRLVKASTVILYGDTLVLDNIPSSNVYPYSIEGINSVYEDMIKEVEEEYNKKVERITSVVETFKEYHPSLLKDTNK